MNETATPSTPKRAGLIESTVLKLFTRRAEVEDVERVGPAFRLVTLRGDALRGVAWTPGDKIQLQMGGWLQRTYTPIDWDAVSGRTRLLAYPHGDGPGARWARGVRPGDVCDIFGPRRSIRLARPLSPVVLFGDETSLGLAAALSDQVSRSAFDGVFEVADLAETAPVVEKLGLAGVRLCVRSADARHVADLERHLSALVQAEPQAEVVLTGQAGSIQKMNRLLRVRGVDSARRQAKAYWAPGKFGLD